MKILCQLFLLLGLSVIFCACEEDAEALSAFRQDFAELYTNAKGQGERLYCDNGASMMVLNKPGGLTRDSIYRVCAMYTEEPHGVTLYNLAYVLSPCPRRFSQQAIKRDPLAVKAIWRSSRYVNLLLALQTSGGSHRFAFVDNGVESRPQGHKLAKVELYHDQNGNAAYYTREAYVSCPVWPYEGILQAGSDSIEFTVNTFEGPMVHRVAY